MNFSLDNLSPLIEELPKDLSCLDLNLGTIDVNAASVSKLLTSIFENNQLETLKLLLPEWDDKVKEMSNDEI